MAYGDGLMSRTLDELRDDYLATATGLAVGDLESVGSGAGWVEYRHAVTRDAGGDAISGVVLRQGSGSARDSITPTLADDVSTRVAMRRATTDPATQAGLQSLVDRCAQVVHTHAGSGTVSANDAARRAALQGFVDAGLVSVDDDGSTVAWSGTPLLDALEALLP